MQLLRFDLPKPKQSNYLLLSKPWVSGLHACVKKKEHQFPLRNVPCKTSMWCCAPGHKHLSGGRRCLAGRLGQGPNYLRAGVQRGWGVWDPRWGISSLTELTGLNRDNLAPKANWHPQDSARKSCANDSFKGSSGWAPPSAGWALTPPSHASGKDEAVFSDLKRRGGL